MTTNQRGDGELEQHPGTACVQIGPDGAPEKQCRLADLSIWSTGSKADTVAAKVSELKATLSVEAEAGFIGATARAGGCHCESAGQLVACASSS